MLFIHPTKSPEPFRGFKLNATEDFHMMKQSLEKVFQFSRNIAPGSVAVTTILILQTLSGVKSLINSEVKQ